MADRNECISEPVPEPSQAPPSPRDQTPAGWDESAGFREIFLYFFDTPEHRQVADAELAALAGRQAQSVAGVAEVLEQALD